jgi:hypothetical protein
VRIDRLSTDADEPDKSGQQPMERMPSYDGSSVATLSRIE